MNIINIDNINENNTELRSVAEIKRRLQAALDSIEFCYSPIRHQGGERKILPGHHDAYRNYVKESYVLLWVLGIN